MRTKGRTAMVSAREDEFMEATKRERILLLGVVPVLAAVTGAVVTVIAQKMFGASAPDDVMLAVIKMEGITAAERLKLLEMVNTNSAKFYSFLNSAAIMLLVPAGGLIWAYAAKIRN